MVGKEEVKSARLASIDVLRGFDMAFIMGGWQLLSALWLACGGTAETGLAAQMTHVPWDGFHFIDWIAPLFLFITGVSFPFSCAGQVKRGLTKGRMALRTMKRGAVLFMLGAICSGFFTSFDIHYGSILGRIGIAWAIAALGYVFLKPRVRWTVWGLGFVAYALLMCLVQAPDHPEASVFSQAGNISGYLDRTVFPRKFLAGGGLYLSQGMLATVLAVPAMVALGMFGGDVLRRPEWTGNRRAAVLFGLGGALLCAGLLLGRVVPVNKTLWSPSYQLLAGGLSLMALAGFYWLINVVGWWRRTLFFRVIGLNAIFIYVAQRIIPFETVADFFCGGLAAQVPANWAGVVHWAGYVAVCWLTLLWLHRRNAYFKV